MPRRVPPRSHGFPRSTGRTAASRTALQRGAVAVEFAIIVPVLVMLLFGITTGGISLTHAIGLSNAVREGARFGATDHPSSAKLPFSTAQWNEWGSDTIARVRGTQFDDATDGTSTTAVCVDMYKVGTGTVSGSAMCNQGQGLVQPALDASLAPAVNTSNIASGTCVVRVWAARNFDVNLVVAPIQAGKIKRSSVARYELRDTEKCP
jgi:Flp pilus assembly protein TadG